MKKHLRVFENLHIPFWLVKDSCWALQFKTLGVAMIFPTLGLSCVIVYKTRHNFADMLPNLAITFWIAANSVWMCDEFFELGIKWVCYIPFFTGLCIMAYWLIAYFPKMWRES